MTTLCLTTDEIAQLTAKKRRPAQRKALKFMCIDHKLRPDGSVVVLRSQLSPPVGATTPAKRTQPNWN